MPAKAPLTATRAQAQLARIGSRLRERRKQLRVSATAAAEAAGLSRVTLHRIERGEASVTIGAYLNALEALGLELGWPAPVGQAAAPPATGARATRQADDAGPLPHRIRLADHAQLRRLAWQLDGASELTPQEALALYERNWRHLDQAVMDAAERTLLQRLVQEVGHGHLLV